MAKDYAYKHEDYRCLELCTYRNKIKKGLKIMIGSCSCQECPLYGISKDKYNYVTCPKIIRRSEITGKTIMRKPK